MGTNERKGNILDSEHLDTELLEARHEALKNHWEAQSLRAQLEKTQAERDRVYKRAEKAEASLYACGTQLATLREAAEAVAELYPWKSDHDANTRTERWHFVAYSRDPFVTLRAALADTEEEK